MTELRTDYHRLKTGDRVRLYPTVDNPLHTEPVAATVHRGQYFCDGTKPETGPDYTFRDVRRYNLGFELLPEPPTPQEKAG